MKRVRINVQSYMKRQEIQDQIEKAGCKPKCCPRCGCHSLWPKKRESMNALSRTDNKTYICPACGQSEAIG